MQNIQRWRGGSRETALERAQRHTLYAAFAAAMAGSFFLGVITMALFAMSR